MHSNPAQYTDPSSQHRLARVQELPPAQDDSDVLSILGDTYDHQYPIYRNGAPPDSAATITTGIAIRSLVVLLSSLFFYYLNVINVKRILI